MRKRKIETCEDCGLSNGNQPANPHFLPCKFSKRNEHAEARVADLWCERWCLDVDNSPIIDAPPTPHEVALLKL